MGIMCVDARSLMGLRRGQSGGRAVTLGRLNMLLHRADLRSLSTLAGYDQAARAWFNGYRWGDYADGFFREVLKFDAVDSIDLSGNEGGTILHDLGQVLPIELNGRFDLAVDGGTLEHVFNFPVAIANLMRLVKIGGVAYMNGPCNNLCGHGFYQFSPELMYRVFSASNGFEILFVRLAKARYVEVALTSRHPVYEVKDPYLARERVNLITTDPVMILTMARRVSACEPFEKSVLQSDYMAGSETGMDDRLGAFRRVKAAVRQTLPHSVISRHVVGLYGRHKASLAYRPSYRRVE